MFGIFRGNPLNNPLNIQRAWHNAQVVTGYDSNKWRKDAHGAWIKFNDYGKHGSPHGWEIVMPFSRSREVKPCPVQCNNKPSDEPAARRSWMNTLMSFMF